MEIIQVRASHKMNHWESEMYLERQRGLRILNWIHMVTRWVRSVLNQRRVNKAQDITAVKHCMWTSPSCSFLQVRSKVQRDPLKVMVNVEAKMLTVTPHPPQAPSSDSTRPLSCSACFPGLGHEKPNVKWSNKRFKMGNKEFPGSEHFNYSHYPSNSLETHLPK